VANTKISDLTAGTDPDGTEAIPGVQSGSTVRFTPLQIRRLRPNPSLVSAAGTDQSGATALSNSFDYHRVGTVGAGAGVKFTALTSGFEGEVRYVRCLSTAANDLTIYPPSGGSFNDQSANVGATIFRDSTLMFIARSTVDWDTFP
jgi:hypothetical protein